MYNLLDVGDGSGWGAKEIADAAVTLGSSKVATGILILAFVFLFGRYYVQPALNGRRKEKDKE